MKRDLVQEVGFIIHTQGYKENSLLLDLFTLNYGRIKAVAKGAKSSRSKLKAILQPFVPLNCTIKKSKSDLWNLYDCVVSGSPYSFNIPDIFCATYINELLFYLFKTQDQEPKLFAKYFETLKNIASKQNIEKSLRDFEFTLLETLGYGIRFEREDGLVLDFETCYEYHFESGFVPSVDANRSFKGKYLIALEQGIYINKESYKIAKRLTQDILLILLGKHRIKSKDLYQEYLLMQGKDHG